MQYLTQHSRLLISFCLTLIIFGLYPTQAAAYDDPLKLMTLNLHNGTDATRQSNLERFIQLVAKEQPDIIALQEIQAKQVKILQLAGYQAISGPNANYLSFCFGNALFTRHKIVYHRHHYLPSCKEQRGVDEVLIELNGRPLRILNTHLGLGWEEQQRQIKEIIRICSYLPGPLIIVGDFNLEPSSKLLTDFPLHEVGAVSGGYKTFPAQEPKSQIDQIWYSPDLSPLVARPLEWFGSDHLPVVASMVLHTKMTIPNSQPEIPDPTLQYNPLLPDVGDRRARLELSRFSDTATATGKTTGSLELPLAKHLSFQAGYDGTNPEVALTVYKTIDLRDYFSLIGVRGKAEWGLTALAASNHETWWEFSQYYRWSNLWGTKLIFTNCASQSKAVWEQYYLPIEKIRLLFGIASDFKLRTGLAFTPDKRQIFQLQYHQTDDNGQYRFSWENRW